MAKKRLVDARKTVIKLSGRIMPLIQVGANPTQVYDEVLQVIAEAPTVDAVEVVRGHWIDRIDNDTPMHECSVCGARVAKGLYEYQNPNLYCYHCGARMDKEE
ncbi:MAG: hypothetical protein ACI3VA_08000 [Candidatus Limivicinus sp.]